VDAAEACQEVLFIDEIDDAVMAAQPGQSDACAQ
jgi:hypothetical protein